jgi:hypothetical protein
MAPSELELDLGGETLACTPGEVAAAFAGLLREIRAAVPFIRPDERAALRRIMARPSGALTVAEVFPAFARESADHVALRRLRTAQFILPAGRDAWERDRRIAVRPFARLVWDRLGEAALFGDAPAPAGPDPVPPDATRVAETARAGKKGQRADDDILDFLQDTPG